MFRRNKTGEWLDRQTAEKKSHRIKCATSDTKQIRKDEQHDQKEHHLRIKDKLICIRKQQLEKEDRSRSKSEKWLEEMYSSGGLWADESDMDQNLMNLSNTKVIAAVKSQIQVRTKILHCESASIVLSKATSAELKAALLQIMNEAIPVELQDLLEIIMNPECDRQQLCAEMVRTRWPH